jgi:anti-anti-sigma factor
VELTSREERGVVVIGARGDLNAGGSDRLERELLSRIEAGQHRLVLDLGDVRYVSSAGLRVFLIAARRTGTGGAFVLARPAPAVRGVLELAGFLTILKVEPDLASAISAAAG